MSSDLQSLLEPVVLSNYLTFVVITAVVYDYVLTFSREIEYIWCKPWTRVSAMFVVIRYIGLCWVVTSALLGSTFVPGPLEVSTVVYLLTSWTFVLFFCATDLVMILRVYTLWKRSKAILYILLFIFLVKTIIDIVFTGIYVNPNTHLSGMCFTNLLCSTTPEFQPMLHSSWRHLVIYWFTHSSHGLRSAYENYMTVTSVGAFILIPGSECCPS
ncbi:hypothetical protein EV363DRAFT_638843 [Boletus edulis]|nr:hypothetical protein EV363DRAFT_638843 [Boletus edulis]